MTGRHMQDKQDVAQRITGTVLWFNESRGYGFIEKEDKSYFVHYSEIDSKGYKRLEDGQGVSFLPGKSAKGLTATSVRSTD